MTNAIRHSQILIGDRDAPFAILESPIPTPGKTGGPLTLQEPEPVASPGAPAPRATSCLPATARRAATADTFGSAGTHCGAPAGLVTIAISIVHFNCCAHAVIVVPTLPEKHPIDDCAVVVFSGST
jgi:hypothetical protein